MEKSGKIPPRYRYKYKDSKISLKVQQKIASFLIMAFIIFSIMFLANLIVETGIFQESKLNNRDLARWDYDESGKMVGIQEFSLSGDEETCWLLVHSYAATPSEMRGLAAAIHLELNQRVEVPLLEGHGTVPSALLGKNLNDWHLQIESELEDLQKTCNNVNVVGSSMSSPIVLKLAEEHELNKIFVLNSFIYLPYKPHVILPLRSYINVLTPLIHYNKKLEIAKINDPAGREEHVAYWNMPYQPIKDSFDFIDSSVADLSKIDEPIFIAHSPIDPTASKKSAKTIHSGVSSDKKELHWYENSGHVLLLDYNKHQLIEHIIKFEREK